MNNSREMVTSTYMFLELTYEDIILVEALLKLFNLRFELRGYLSDLLDSQGHSA